MSGRVLAKTEWINRAKLFDEVVHSANESAYQLNIPRVSAVFVVLVSPRDQVWLITCWYYLMTSDDTTEWVNLGMFCVTPCCILIATLRCFKIYKGSARSITTRWLPHFNSDGEPPYLAIILCVYGWTTHFLDFDGMAWTTRIVCKKFKTYTISDDFCSFVSRRYKISNLEQWRGWRQI